MHAPPDTELQRMSDKELAILWAKRPRYPVSASELDWTRVAKEVGYRERHKQPSHLTPARQRD